MASKPNNYRDPQLRIVFQDFELAEAAVAPSRPPQLIPWAHSVSPMTDLRHIFACEALEICQRNLNASFGLLTRLAGARSFGEILALQVAYLTIQGSALLHQAEELANLSTQTAISLLRGSGRAG
jgi:phasin protein